MWCQGKVDSLESGRATGTWGERGGPAVSLRRAGLWSGLRPGLSFPCSRYLHCTFGSGLGHRFPGCRWGAQGHPAGWGLSKAP